MYNILDKFFKYFIINLANETKINIYKKIFIYKEKKINN